MNSHNEIPSEATAKKVWSEPVLTTLSVSLETFGPAGTGADGAPSTGGS